MITPVVLTTSSGKQIEASVVYLYDRDDIAPTEAPTFRNMAVSVFNQVPQAGRVAVLSLAGPTVLFLFEAAHRWFDLRGEPVSVKRGRIHHMEGL